MNLFLQGILMIKECCNLVGQKHLAYNFWTTIFPDIGFVLEKTNCKVFRFRLPLERMTKFSKNCKKTFHYFKTKIFFSMKSTSTSSSSFLDFYHCTKFQHNLMNRFSEKLFTEKCMEEWIIHRTTPQRGLKYIYSWMIS